MDEAYNKKIKLPESLLYLQVGRYYLWKLKLPPFLKSITMDHPDILSQIKISKRTRNIYIRTLCEYDDKFNYHTPVQIQL
jgi:hypothetical protein